MFVNNFLAHFNDLYPGAARARPFVTRVGGWVWLVMGDGQQEYSRPSRHWVGRCASLGCVVGRPALGRMTCSWSFVVHGSLLWDCNRCFVARSIVLSSQVLASWGNCWHCRRLWNALVSAHMVDINLFASYVNVQILDEGSTSLAFPPDFFIF